MKRFWLIDSPLAPMLVFLFGSLVGCGDGPKPTKEGTEVIEMLKDTDLEWKTDVGTFGTKYLRLKEIKVDTDDGKVYASGRELDFLTATDKSEIKKQAKLTYNQIVMKEIRTTNHEALGERLKKLKAEQEAEKIKRTVEIQIEVERLEREQRDKKRKADDAKTQSRVEPMRDWDEPVKVASGTRTVPVYTVQVVPSSAYQLPPALLYQPFCHPVYSPFLDPMQNRTMVASPVCMPSRSSFYASPTVIGSAPARRPLFR